MLVLFELVHKSQMSTHSSRAASEEILSFNAWSGQSGENSIKTKI